MGGVKLGKNDAKFRIYEPFELESQFFIEILRTIFDYIYEVFIKIALQHWLHWQPFMKKLHDIFFETTEPISMKFHI